MLIDALKRINEGRPEWSIVKLTPVEHPSKLPEALNVQPDVVLADVFYDIPEINRLAEIIQYVKEWDSKSKHGFPTPIIAYTKGGSETLKECFEQRKDLFDIWHKLSANADYVAWRFQKLAEELPRFRPDATIQKLIASMKPSDCPAWHDRVCELAKDYGRGQTEYDQINNCKASLRIILDKVDAKNSATYVTLWNALADSEPLLRTADQKLRGIARHSINVFWFGYWLINHPLLKDAFCNMWEEMQKSRTDTPHLKKAKASDALNAIWLLTSLFHDACRFYEHSKSITEKCDDYFKDFKSLEMGHSSWLQGNVKALLNAIDPLLSSNNICNSDSMVVEIKKHIELCSQKEKPDHGAVAAAYIMKGTGKEDLYSEYAAEAARAIFLHTCLPRVFENLPKDGHDHFIPIESMSLT
jgi:hypothetical protein